MKNIYISILNYNGAKDTIECLESLQKVQRDGFELHILVIDNASKETFVLPKDFQQKYSVTIVRTEENKGFAGGNNVAMKLALEKGADYVLLLNNDTTVHENFLTELFSTAESDEKIGIVAPKIYFVKGSEFHKDRYKTGDIGNVIWYAGGIFDWGNVIGSHRGVDEVDHGQYDTKEPTAFASGCCMLIKIEVLQKIGLFDEKYFLYYEDNDLVFRVKKAGYKIMYSPKAVVWHKNASSTGGSGSSMQDYYITRNRLLFGLGYAPLRSKIALVKESLVLLLNGRSMQKKGVIDFYKGKLGKGSMT